MCQIFTGSKEMNELHFISTYGKDTDGTGCRCVDHKTLSYSSGTWAVSEKIAQESIDKKIYIHDTKAGQSRHGGIITSFERHESGRYTFFYTAHRSCFGVYFDKWGQEKGYA